MWARAYSVRRAQNEGTAKTALLYRPSRKVVERLEAMHVGHPMLRWQSAWGLRNVEMT